MTRTSLAEQKLEPTGEMIELQEQVEKLRAELEEQVKLVQTILTVFLEEADGVQSGAAPTIPNQPTRGYCM